MLFWVFDLDYTLYNLQKTTRFEYDLLKEDYELNYLLSMLPLKKAIFTNGTNFHAYKSTYLLNITDRFDYIYGRDDFNSLKPHINSFNNFKNLSKIENKDKVVFFEDTIENLIEAKKIGWITVLISFKKPQDMTSIDFYFENIHLALKYFIHHIYNK